MSDWASSGAIATAYTGPGPWGSLDPATPALPAQALEAAGVLALAVALGVVAVEVVADEDDPAMLVGEVLDQAVDLLHLHATFREVVRHGLARHLAAALPDAIAGSRGVRHLDRERADPGEREQPDWDFGSGQGDGHSGHR